jgi:4-hydroxy-3-polyprenylbenzoate decarboxylase
MTKFAGKITLAFSGASGAPYGMRLLEALVAANYQVYLLISSAARVVFTTESDIQIPASPDKASEFFKTRLNADPQQVIVFGKDQWMSPVASGSAAPKRMVICPCSTGTISAIATGASDNLIERAADVVIKERGQLIVVPRETPLNAIVLENLLKLSRVGVTIMPAAPGFYHQPQSIDDLVDFMVGRILDHLGLAQELVPKWGYSK